MAKEKNPREEALKKASKLVKVFSFIFILTMVFGLAMYPILNIPTVTEFIATFNLTPDAIDSTVSTVVLIIAGISFLFMIGAIIDKGKVKRSYCPYCGEPYDYEDDIEWDVSDVITDSKKRTATVQFNCTCSECGKETSFSKKLTVASLDNNGKLTEYNIYDLARKCFKKID